MRLVGSMGRIGLTALLLAGIGACGGNAASDAPPATAAAAPSAATSTSTSAAAVATASAAPAAAEAPPADQAGDEDQLATDLRDHHGHHHGGFTHLIVMSVETIGGTPEQKEKIEKVRADLQEKIAPVREANKKLLATLEEVLADGTASAAESAKVDAAVAQIAAASKTAHGASADAINQLHSILDAAQRAELVAKVDAQWKVWRTANAADDKDNNGIADAEEGRLAHLTKKLSLTPDQVEKIKAALKSGAYKGHKLDSAEIDAHVKKFSDAFVKDSFDAKSLKGEQINAHLASAGAARMARFYLIITPILTPDQRTKELEHFHNHQSKGQNLPSAGT